MEFKDSKLSHSDFLHCIEVLKETVNNRVILGQLSLEERKELLILAGRLSRPDRLEMMKLAKKHRLIKKRKEDLQDRQTVTHTQIRKAREATFFVPAPQLMQNKELPERELNKARACYICKEDFTKLHFFYDTICPSCSELNYKKRFQTTSLKNKTVLITGSRLKIGYQATLMCLRAGAKVIATTRFPKDSANRFQNEKDFEEWGHLLDIHGLDLRHSPSVELFTRFLCNRLDGLDILINNAAQTVRRPPGFYKHLMEIESLPVEKLNLNAQSLLKQHEECKLNILNPSQTNQVVSWTSNMLGMGIRSSALLSQIPYVIEDNESEEEIFPIGKTDADLQQIDLRKNNSWRMKLADVSTPELIEVQLVNTIAPFILCSKLKPLMLKNKTFDKHIVNVSAMEGKFSRYTKTDKHPHTNMAKASLNMMTVTSAPDYAKDGIYMNAVDTGWVTDEDPAVFATRKQIDHDFQPPLDIVDGAARICDPFFSGLITGEHIWGKFLKDYQPTTW